MSVLFRSTRALAVIAIAAASGAAILWAKVLADAWPTLLLQGTICGRPDGFLGHCPLCFPAAALTGVALAAASGLFGRWRKAAPCPVKL